MFGFLKRKVKFKSDKPPIISSSNVLKETEKWFNNLISYKGFSFDEDHVKCGRTTIYIRFEKPFKTIFDAVIEKSTKQNPYVRFSYCITISALWSSKYHYKTWYEKKNPEDGLIDEYQVKENEIIWNQSEVPLPQFSFYATLWEQISNKRAANLILEKNEDVQSLEELKNEYQLFNKDLNKILNKHNLSISNISNYSHPTNISFYNQRKKNNLIN